MNQLENRKRRLDSNDFPAKKKHKLSVESSNQSSNVKDNSNSHQLNRESKNSKMAAIGGIRPNKAGKKGKGNKKIKIKPFKVKPKLAESFEKDTIDKLMEAVEAVHAKQAANCGFEELYKACQSLCTLKKGKLIYDRLYNVCDNHLASVISSVDLQISHPQSFLEPLRTIWDDHREQMHAIRQIFLMLDRTYVRQSDVKSLWSMGIILLKKHVDARPGITQLMIGHILSLIKCERNGEEVDKSLLKGVIHMIQHLEIYKPRFENDLINTSEAYYRDEGIKLIQSMNIPDYLNHVIKRLNEEHARCINYLHSSTQRKLKFQIEKQMIKQHCKAILEKGFDSMSDESKFTDLRHLYKLFNCVSELDILREYFEQYMRKRGLTIVKDEQNDKEMVQRLLAFKGKIDNCMQKSFENNSDFNGIVRKAWEYFLNERQNKPAELIAKFIDHQLRTGARGISEQELEESLDRVMDIFRFIHGKDVFQAFYKKDLAKRLLLSTSASEDTEKSMISRVRKECGASFSSNLENMFKDIDISVDLMNKFRLKRKDGKDGKDGSFELEVQVLTSGCWPSYDTDPINLPRTVQECLEDYKKFYVHINNGRQLKWTSSLSHCIIGANFPKGRKELVLSAFQGCVLLLFNDANRYKFEELLDRTNIKKQDLKSTLLSLVKGKILMQKTESKDKNTVLETDEFKLNGKYTNRLLRVKVNQVQIIESKSEQKATTHRIMQDRQYQIDACVVRVMKARKSLTHQQLMAEVLKQLKFDCQPKQVKLRIAALIENEYMERDKNNNSLYHYKA